MSTRPGAPGNDDPERGARVISAARSNPRRANFRPFHFGACLRLGEDVHVDNIDRARRRTAAKSSGANASAWIVYQVSLGALARTALVGNVATGVNFHETTLKTKERLMLGAHQDAAKLDDAGVTVIIAERQDVIAKGVKNGNATRVMVANLQDDGRRAAIDRGTDDIVL